MYQSMNIYAQETRGSSYYEVRGKVLEVNDLHTTLPEDAGCIKIIAVENTLGFRIYFYASPSTYFIDRVKIKAGDEIIVFYQSGLPGMLVYPPQFNASVIALWEEDRFIKVDRFNHSLVSADGSLELIVTDKTEVILENGQLFYGSLGNRNLIVEYRTSTRSIPAQTVPERIVVLCSPAVCGR